MTIYSLSDRLDTMLNTQTIKSLTDLRLNPMAISQLAKNEGPVYIFNRNHPINVLLDVEDYEDLIDRLDDAKDALMMQGFERRDKSKMRFHTLKK